MRPLHKRAAEISDRLVRLSDFGRENDKAITILSTATDPGNSTTTILRKGLVMGRLSTGKWDACSDGSIVVSTHATVTNTGQATYDLTGGKTLTLDVDGLPVTLTTTGLISTSASATVASCVAVFNALALSQGGAAANLSFSASGSSFIVITHRIQGMHRYFRVTGGTGNTSFVFATTKNHGTDGQYGILTDSVNMKYKDLAAVADQFGNIGTTGFWDESELLSMTSDAKTVLIRNGAVFR